MNNFCFVRWKAPLLQGLFLLSVMLLPLDALGQMPNAADLESQQPLALSLDEALQIALINNYAIRDARLDVDLAEAQVNEGQSQLYPQLNLSSSYTRNLKSANPFSGSSAGNLFSSFGFVDWLAYNERARTDTDPISDPLTFGDFLDRQQDGLDAAGIVPSTEDNPFFVPNQYQAGLTLSQKIFDYSAFIAVKGAKRFLRTSRANTLERQEQILVDQVRTAFYQALLSIEQASVTRQSIDRTRQTVQEIAQQVSQGVTPKFQRLSAEVELANLETTGMQLDNAAMAALDQLKMVTGIPVNQPIRLIERLEVDDLGTYMTIAAEDAVEIALNNRPDLEATRLNIELQKLNARVTRSTYLPTLSAFANLSYLGNVPSNRTVVFTDPDDPFTFSSSDLDYFSKSYWNPGVNVGISLSWKLFDGFQSRSLMQQQQISAQRSEIMYEQQLQGVRQEVQMALRSLEASRRQLLSQEKNVERAELNYTFARKRLSEGVAAPLEERNASDQLDQSRLNYYQAMHDYLRARSAFETTLGIPLAGDDSLNLTSNQ